MQHKAGSVQNKAANVLYQNQDKIFKYFPTLDWFLEEMLMFCSDRLSAHMHVLDDTLLVLFQMKLECPLVMLTYNISSPRLQSVHNLSILKDMKKGEQMVVQNLSFLHSELALILHFMTSL
jgi:hypothetical protein